MVDDSENPSRREALLRFTGVAGAVTIGTGAYWRWRDESGTFATDSTGLTLLDARGGSGLLRRALPGAVEVRWQDFAERDVPRRGFLLPDHRETARRFAELGVHPERPTLVVGNGMDGWGEEGRIVWLLWYLGVNNAGMMGIDEWRRTGSVFRPVCGVASEWIPRIDHTLRCSVGLATPGTVILDVRGRDEFLGTPRFGEARGGHVPGARHLRWNTFFNQGGMTYDTAALTRHLEGLGVSRDLKVVCYCTGGVRSAYLTVRLRQAGYAHAASDDGGMWAYAATDAPLVTGDE